LGDGVVLHNGSLRGLTLAAGLWLSASAALAAPQPGLDMSLGASALPPVGYVAFCERKPQDCGADVATVVAGARRADSDRAELAAQLGAAITPALAPAALGAPALLTVPAAPAAPPDAPEAELAPPPVVLEVGVVPAVIQTAVEFVDPVAEARALAEAHAPRMTPKLWSLLNRVNGQVNGAIAQSADLVTYGRDDFWNTPLEEGRAAGDCEDYVLEKERALIAAGVPRAALNIALVTTRWGESHAVLLVATSEGEYVLDNLSPWLLTWREAPYRWLRRQVNGEAFNWVMIEDRGREREPRLVMAAASR
jgi:predicted transglutaminase-like cysteine proteinase